jgi:Na+/melibiose symporter-like transporter
MVADVAQAASALGTILAGFALDLISFPKSALPGTISPEVVFNLGVVQGPLTSLFTLASLLLYLGYRLDKKRHSEIRDALAKRNLTSS